ncbi:hypothetical protein [Pseudomonas poae]|uniref:hypothetical protein n=1 Tax=Pseudomonas poae TaxID=200451 RepID=UPI003BB1DC2E
MILDPFDQLIIARFELKGHYECCQFFPIVCKKALNVGLAAFMLLGFVILFNALHHHVDLRRGVGIVKRAGVLPFLLLKDVDPEKRLGGVDYPNLDSLNPVRESLPQIDREIRNRVRG